MATTYAQRWSVYRYGDNQIVLTGTVDATGWALVFVVGGNRPGTGILQITPSVTGVVITVPLPRAALDAATLPQGEYPAALWRTDNGSYEPLAVGTLAIVNVPTPN